MPWLRVTSRIVLHAWWQAFDVAIAAIADGALR